MLINRIKLEKIENNKKFLKALIFLVLFSIFPQNSHTINKNSVFKILGATVASYVALAIGEYLYKKKDIQSLIKYKNAAKEIGKVSQNMENSLNLINKYKDKKNYLAARDRNIWLFPPLKRKIQAIRDSISQEIQAGNIRLENLIELNKNNSLSKIVQPDPEINDIKNQAVVLPNKEIEKDQAVVLPNKEIENARNQTINDYDSLKKNPLTKESLEELLLKIKQYNLSANLYDNFQKSTKLEKKELEVKIKEFLILFDRDEVLHANYEEGEIEPKIPNEELTVFLQSILFDKNKNDIKIFINYLNSYNYLRKIFFNFKSEVKNWFNIDKFSLNYTFFKNNNLLFKELLLNYLDEFFSNPNIDVVNQILRNTYNLETLNLINNRIKGINEHKKADEISFTKDNFSKIFNKLLFLKKNKRNEFLKIFQEICERFTDIFNIYNEDNYFELKKNTILNDILAIEKNEHKTKIKKVEDNPIIKQKVFIEKDEEKFTLEIFDVSEKEKLDNDFNEYKKNLTMLKNELKSYIKNDLTGDSSFESFYEGLSSDLLQKNDFKSNFPKLNLLDENKIEQLINHININFKEKYLEVKDKFDTKDELLKNLENLSNFFPNLFSTTDISGKPLLKKDSSNFIALLKHKYKKSKNENLLMALRYYKTIGIEQGETFPYSLLGVFSKNNTNFEKNFSISLLLLLYLLKNNNDIEKKSYINETLVIEQEPGVYLNTMNVNTEMTRFINGFSLPVAHSLLSTTPAFYSTAPLNQKLINLIITSAPEFIQKMGERQAELKFNSLELNKNAKSILSNIYFDSLKPISLFFEKCSGPGYGKRNRARFFTAVIDSKDPLTKLNKVINFSLKSLIDKNFNKFIESNDTAKKLKNIFIQFSENYDIKKLNEALSSYELNAKINPLFFTLNIDGESSNPHTKKYVKKISELCSTEICNNNKRLLSTYPELKRKKINENTFGLVIDLTNENKGKLKFFKQLNVFLKKHLTENLKRLKKMFELFFYSEPLTSEQFFNLNEATAKEKDEDQIPEDFFGKRIQIIYRVEGKINNLFVTLKKSLEEFLLKKTNKETETYIFLDNVYKFFNSNAFITEARDESTIFMSPNQKNAEIQNPAPQGQSFNSNVVVEEEDDTGVVPFE